MGCGRTRTSVDCGSPNNQKTDREFEGHAEADAESSGRITHREKVIAAREQRLKDAEIKYLNELRLARQMYFEDRKEAKKRHDEWLRPSVEMNEIVAMIDGHEPCTPKSAPSLSSFSLSETAKLRILSLQETFAAMSEDELAEEELRMSGRQMEVESILRLPLESSGDLSNAYSSLRKSVTFLEQLEQLSKQLGANIGLVFQELLGQADVAIEGHLGRPRQVGIVKLEEVLQGNELQQAIEAACDLCRSVRVKIEDANDLSLAGMVVEDSRQFFEQLHALAEVKHPNDVFALFEQLSDKF